MPPPFRRKNTICFGYDKTVWNWITHFRQKNGTFAYSSLQNGEGTNHIEYKDMEMKDVFKRYLVFVIGLYFLAAGIVLIVRSALGTTPISSVNYVLSLNSPLSLGTCTFLINMLLIMGQFWLIRKIIPNRIPLKYFFNCRSPLSFQHSLISIWHSPVIYIPTITGCQ